MSEGNVVVGTEVGAPAANPVGAAAVESPPKVKVVERAEVQDARKELAQLAGEVAKRGSRRLLWEYLRLRSRVVGK
jgi:hypothetical protein